MSKIYQVESEDDFLARMRTLARKIDNEEIVASYEAESFETCEDMQAAVARDKSIEKARSLGNVPSVGAMLRNKRASVKVSRPEKLIKRVKGEPDAPRLLSTPGAARLAKARARKP